MPFKNYSITKGGQLTIAQISSPNFSIPGKTGWAILKNGNAYFFNITAQGTITATEFDGTDFTINSAGEFFYSGTPALGNLLISIARAAGTDAEGNSYNAGTFVYGPSGSFVGLLNDGSFAQLQMFPPGPLTSSTSKPSVLAKALNAGAANEQAFAVLTSGKESSRNDAAVQVFSDSADGTLVATTSFEFGGSIYATITQAAVTIFAVPLVIKNQTIPGVQFIPSGLVHLTSNPEVFANQVNPGAANEQALAVLTSGKESSNADAALQLFSTTADATSAARAVIEFGGTVYATFPSNGSMTVVDGIDGQTYQTQRKTIVLGSNTPVAASPGTSVFSSPVGTRTYRLHGVLYVAASGVAQQLSLGIGIPGGPAGQISVQLGRATALIAITEFASNALTGIGAAASLAAGSTYVCVIDAVLPVTGSGNIAVTCAGTNASDITINANSFIDIWPV